MIDGATIRLRSPLADDVPPLASWRNNLALQSQLMVRPRGSDLDAVRAWLAGRSAADRLFFVLAKLDGNSAVGYLQFENINFIDGCADFGICIAPEAQGRGIGSEAIRLAMSYLRMTWGLRKLSLRVLADNQHAIRLYLKSGFVECGRQQRHFCLDGTFKDVVLMELFVNAAVV